jgi:23S rRNA (uracil1939-C5)-methyltransferase
MAKWKAPCTVRIDGLDERASTGVDAEGRRWKVRNGPVGADLHVAPGRNQTARRLAVERPAPDAVDPRCPVFGVCGGCQLQEMPLDAQRQAKQALVTRLVGAEGVVVHPIRGAPAAYHYRNKLELSFSPRRFVPEGEPAPPPGGSWLGFHPPGWFAKVVPIPGCPLGTPTMNRLIAEVAAAAPEPAWDTLAGAGGWRHLVLREDTDGRLLVTLVTSATVTGEQVEALAARFIEWPEVRTVLHVANDGVAEVATGRIAAVLKGAPTLEMTIGAPAGPLHLSLPHDGFFQVNTAGSERLFAVIDEALGDTKGTLLDLYCGVGVIGLSLAHRYARLIGVELHAGAIEIARENARRNHIQGEWTAGTVEAVLPTLRLEGPLAVVVDPPRAGLHPSAARFLAGLPAEVLVYVACNPASLGRDRAVLAEGGWRLEALWSVDLFPQTPHVEAIGRFVRG